MLFAHLFYVFRSQISFQICNTSQYITVLTEIYFTAHTFSQQKEQGIVSYMCAYIDIVLLRDLVSSFQVDEGKGGSGICIALHALGSLTVLLNLTEIGRGKSQEEGLQKARVGAPRGR